MALNALSVGVGIFMVFVGVILLMAQAIGGFGFTAILFVAFGIISYSPLMEQLRDQRFAVGLDDVERQGMTWATPALMEYLYKVGFELRKDLEPNLEGLWAITQYQLKTHKGFNLRGYVPDDAAILPQMSAYICMIEPSVTHAKDSVGRPIQMFCITDLRTGWLTRIETIHISSVKQFIDEEAEKYLEVGGFNTAAKPSTTIALDAIPPGMLPYMRQEGDE